MATFRELYDNPPHGTIHDAYASTRGTADFHRPTAPNMMPNEIVDAPELAGDLVRWAQGYLDQVLHSPGQQLIQSAGMISAQLDRSQAGNEGTVTSLYARIIETWSSEFVAHADNVPHQTVKFEECGQISGVRSDWEWTRGDGTRMVVEHKGRNVFNNYCHDIRRLAESSAPLAFDDFGAVRGAASILVRLGIQMIANNCQFGVVFGGKRFILLAIVDQLRNGTIVHQMRCSDILETVPAAGTSFPGAIQITIAALLGPKGAFFEANGMAVDIVQTYPEARPPAREASKKGKPTSESRRKGKGRIQTAQDLSAQTSVLTVAYWSYPKSGRLFTRVDTTDSKSGEIAGDLVLYDTLGDSFSGAVIDADFQRDDQSMEVVAKFYDPDTEELVDKESEVPESEEAEPCLPNKEKKYCFRHEIETYKRLSGSSICPRFYGAFQGADVSGFQTGVILMEKLPVIFHKFDEMTEQERKIAYDHVLELHRRGTHHGDVRGGNFGRREVTTVKRKTGSKRKRSKNTGVDGNRSTVVICDFSHSDVFESCDPEQCPELRSARERLLEGAPEP